MSNIPANVGREFQIEDIGSNLAILGDASMGVVGTLVVQVVDEGSLNCSIVVKARIRLPEAAADGVGFVGWRYSNDFVNGAQGDGTMIVTPITGNSLIRIPASGVQIGLDITFTSGKGKVFVQSLEGAAV